METRLFAAIVGFGKFGQFLARRFAKEHAVTAWSRGDKREQAEAMDVGWRPSMEDLCAEQPDVVVLSTSILSTEEVVRSLPVSLLKRDTTFVDVLSVKEFPRRLFQAELPPHFDFVCTHPMFGPDSGQGSWENLPFVFERARVSKGNGAVERFLEFFREEGCRMVEMECKEHDKQAASSQFITHTVGRVLGMLDLPDTDINTKGYEALLNLVDNTANDSFELYYGLFLYNQNATDELDRLEQAFHDVKARLHAKLAADASPSSTLPQVEEKDPLPSE